MQMINSHSQVGGPTWKQTTRRPSCSTNCRQLTLLVRCDGAYAPSDGKPSSSATTVHRLIAEKGALLIPGQQPCGGQRLTSQFALEKRGSCLVLTCQATRVVSGYIPSVSTATLASAQASPSMLLSVRLL